MSALWPYLLTAVCLLYQLAAEDVSNVEPGPKVAGDQVISNQSSGSEEQAPAAGEGGNGPSPGPETQTTGQAQSTDTTKSAQCKRPDGRMLTMDKDNESYNKGDTVTVYCQPGYRPSPSVITCVSPGTAIEWDHTPLCIAQCKKPEGRMLTMDPEKEFYNEGETLTQYCQVGYRPSPSPVTCVNRGAADIWDKTPQCIPLCKRPDGTIQKMDPEKEFYRNRESVTVKCEIGYRPSYPSVQCVNRGTSNEWNYPPQCIAQCAKPTIQNVLSMTEDRSYYNKGDELRVQCKSGYHLSSPSMRCDRPRTLQEWTPPTIKCTAQCAHPAIRNMKKNLDGYKEYYNKNKEISVQCDSGYYPSSPTMRCDNPRTAREWTPYIVTCIAQCAHPTIRNMKHLHGYKEYYNKNEEISVQCDSGYYPSSPTMRCDYPRTPWEWTPPTVTCIALCKKPEGTILKMDPEKEFYGKGESVTVNCKIGYRPSYPSVQCVTRGATNEWDYPPQCIAQCAKPTIQNVLSVTGERTYYNQWDEVRVQCETGYHPSSPTMRCDNPPKWTPPTITCTAQCAHPAIRNMKNLDGYKEYYNKYEVISVQCDSGYYPSSPTMRCDRPRTPWEWTLPTSTCTGVTMTDWRITKTSISVRISCNPQCPDHWRFTVQCCAEPNNYGSCETSYDRSATFTDLQPNSLYRIHTFWGQYSLYKIHTKWEQYSLKSEDIRTGESVPGKPEIKYVPSMKNKTIRWSLSERWGTITGFQMNISAWRDYNVSFAVNKSFRLPSDVTEYNITLRYGTNYTITLRGFTAVGAGEVTTQNKETYIGAPPRHMEKTLSDVTLQLHPVLDLNGPIKSYEIIVSGGQEGNVTMDCQQYNNTKYNSSSALSPYTAAVLPAEDVTGPRTFNLGDDQHYNGFHNAPLIPKHNYTVYIRVTSRWKHVEKSSCAFAGFLRVASRTGHIIAGSVSAVVILLILLLLVILWKRRFSRKSRHSSDIPLKAQIGPGKKRDIPADRLLEVVKKFRNMELEDRDEDEEENANISPAGRYLEYQDLPSGLLACTVGQAEENQAKNRYKKVLPYDDSRVVLRSTRSDYINASYIDGFRAPKFYIATQGPLPETLADFWSMVWQENSSVIVMLTGLQEQNKVKCERYWPEQSQTYGDITVSVQKIIQTGAITIRTFSLKKAQSAVQITVEQLQYLRWPDHGVPKNSSDLIQLIELMNKCNSPGSGAIVVHCSAGIGRTGTFVALDILLKMAHTVKKVNVYNCVSGLRKKRVKMVQEKEQYIFLYDALLEGFLCGNTIVSISDIQKHIGHMSVRDNKTKMSGYDKEFQVLQKLSELYKIYQCKEGKKPENQVKNRYPNILPGDHCRPVLMSAVNARGAPGYINAVFVNSNSQEDALIVTQLPTRQTLNDFWAMVWDYKCTAMVMMQRAQDLSENTFRFFPYKGETSYGFYKVKRTAKTSGNGYSGSTFDLRKTDQTFDNSLEVKLWQLDSWPLDKPIPENPAAVISLIAELEKCPSKVPGSHTLVTCCDGASRSGLFCAGLIICDQIRSDGCLDVSQAVRSIRRRRYQFIPTVEQYSFCYTLAQSYLDSFETYGNFK